MKLEAMGIGVIGIGGRGRLAELAHKPEEGSLLVAGADTAEEQRQGFVLRHGRNVFVTADYRELIARSDVDAVFVCSPDYLHEEHAVAALSAGKAVYLEKPMATTTSGADRILTTALKSGTPLYVGHNMRHMPFVQKMRELIVEGAIGEVTAGWCRHFVGNGGDFYFRDWHSERKNTTGLLLQKGAHDIDVLHWLCGGYTRRVTGMGGLTLYDRVTNRRAPGDRVSASPDFSHWPPLRQTKLSPVIDVEDLSMILMQLENGVFASYQQCHYTPDYWRNYTIIGTEGRLENSGDGSQDTVIRLWNKRTTFNPDGDEIFPAPASAGTHGGADPAIVAEFLDFVRRAGKTKTSPVAARYAVATGVAATDSLRNHSIPVDVVPLPATVREHFEPKKSVEGSPG